MWVINHDQTIIIKSTRETLNCVLFLNMTLYEFLVLDEMKQAEAIWDAVHIGERWDHEHNILLYQRDDFYIEVFHHKKLNIIRRIHVFRNADHLEPYLRQISAVDLIKAKGE